MPYRDASTISDTEASYARRTARQPRVASLPRAPSITATSRCPARIRVPSGGLGPRRPESCPYPRDHGRAISSSVTPTPTATLPASGGHQPPTPLSGSNASINGHNVMVSQLVNVSDMLGAAAGRPRFESERSHSYRAHSRETPSPHTRGRSPSRQQVERPVQSAVPAGPGESPAQGQ